jgi:hypothetical protein
MQGWIKFHRSIVESEIYGASKAFSLVGER